MAPGRINLIGEHVDYNEGFVMPAAVANAMTFAVSASGSDRCNLLAVDFDEGVTFSIHDLNPGGSWVNYMQGVMDGFMRRGARIKGVDCIFGGNIPAGAGLSSSAALCAGFAFALNETFDTGFSRLELAKIAQYSEHEFAGVKCGLMDQYASLFGEKDAVLLFDCRRLIHESIPFHFSTHSLLLIDTKVKHSLADSAYNDRRRSCEEGLTILRKRYPQVTALRDATRTMLYEYQDEMGEETFIKCLYVVEEIARTLQAAECLKKKDIAGFGELMYQSHWGLSQAYEVSCEELDHLVMAAEEDKELVPGARMMGGGFGGCTINLVRSGREGIFKERVRKKYFAAFKKEPDFYTVTLSEGVHVI